MAVTELRTTTLKKGLVLQTVKLAERCFRTFLFDRNGRQVGWPDGMMHATYDNYIDAITQHEEIVRKLMKTF